MKRTNEFTPKQMATMRRLLRETKEKLGSYSAISRLTDNRILSNTLGCFVIRENQTMSIENIAILQEVSVFPMVIEEQQEEQTTMAEVGLIPQIKTTTASTVAFTKVDTKPGEGWDTVKDMAVAKGCSQATIRNWCKSGKKNLNVVRFGRRLFIQKNEAYDAAEKKESSAVSSLRQEIAELKARIKTLENEQTTTTRHPSFTQMESYGLGAPNA